jgi:hypothetical protein
MAISLAVYKLQGRSNKLLCYDQSCHSWRLVILIVFFVYPVHTISNIRSVSKYALRDWCSLTYVRWCRCSMEFVILEMNCSLSEPKIGSSIEVQYLKIKSVVFKEALNVTWRFYVLIYWQINVWVCNGYKCPVYSDIYINVNQI